MKVKKVWIALIAIVVLTGAGYFLRTDIVTSS
jgi:Ni,Fe-hydrogenase I cytochrome b subunit